MSKADIKPLQSIIDDKWNNDVISNKSVKEIYPSKRVFIQNFLNNDGLKHWLEKFNGLTLSLSTVNSIAITLVRFSHCTPKSVHTQLALLCRNQEIELPDVYGILTQEYWVGFFKDRKTAKRY